jgi:hypothetical protein
VTSAFSDAAGLPAFSRRDALVAVMLELNLIRHRWQRCAWFGGRVEDPAREASRSATTTMSPITVPRAITTKSNGQSSDAVYSNRQVPTWSKRGVLNANAPRQRDAIQPGKEDRVRDLSEHQRK